ncbi:unnamed protein product, partial [Cuscuta campestris]
MVFAKFEVNAMFVTIHLRP